MLGRNDRPAMANRQQNGCSIRVVEHQASEIGSRGQRRDAVLGAKNGLSGRSWLDTTFTQGKREGRGRLAPEGESGDGNPSCAAGHEEGDDGPIHIQTGGNTVCQSFQGRATVGRTWIERKDDCLQLGRSGTVNGSLPG